MKVIVYCKDAVDMREAQACLKWALSEPDLNTAGAMHHSGKSSFFEKRSSGTIVIHVQRNSEAEESKREADHP